MPFLRRMPPLIEHSYEAWPKISDFDRRTMKPMNTMILISAAVAAALFVYLVVALVYAEEL